MSANSLRGIFLETAINSCAVPLSTGFEISIIATNSPLIEGVLLFAAVQYIILRLSIKFFFRHNQDAIDC